jgi:hypothetical protein
MRGYANRPEDLWERIARGGSDDCWPFLGARSRKGYGQMRLGGRQIQAHRLAFRLAHGIDPGALFVCHRCDNPPCCNPAHLFLGTHLDNNRDCKAKGRNTAGERHHTAKLDEDQVRAIRARRATGELGIDLASEFGVTPALISAIHLRKIWSLA